MMETRSAAQEGQPGTASSPAAASAPVAGAAHVGEADLARAVRMLQAGGVIGLPTETVYGLAANAADAGAVASIYRIKGRPADHPLIVHVASAEAAARWAVWSPQAQRLAAAFWPGPLTLVLPRRPEAPPFASAGQDTIALRVSSHPVFAQLMQALAPVGITGLAAPSANRFGRISPSRAAHVRSGLGEAVPLVLDGGPSAVGVESTIVDLSRGQPVLLRPGGISLQALSDCLGVPVRAADTQATAEADAPRVPGALPSHYAPSVPVRLLPASAVQALYRDWAREADAPGVGVEEGSSGCSFWSEAGMQALAGEPAGFGTPPALPVDLRPGLPVALWTRQPPPERAGAFWRRQPADAATAARHLYDTLHQLDALGVQAILVEMPPDTPEWRAVRDRLTRAAA